MDNVIAPPAAPQTPAPRPAAASWTLIDMVVVVGASLASVVLLVVLLRVAVQAGILNGLRDDIVGRPVVTSFVAGVIIYGIFLAFTYLRIVRRPHVGWRGLGFRTPPLIQVLLAPAIVLGQLGAVMLVNLLLIAAMGEFENPQVESITGGQGFNWLNFILMLVLAGGVAPFVEEVVFRGLLYGWLRKRMPVAAAVLASAAIFSVAHIIPILLPALLVMGITLAIAYELSGSLWLPILIHAMHNSLTVAIVFMVLAIDPQMLRM